jgi:hypothetical protein
VASVTMSHLSTQYVQVPIQAIVAGQAYDPTSDTVQLAFMTAWGAPGSGDWKAGTWDTSTAPGIYLAQCLVGPGGTTTLAAGDYAIWVKITDSPHSAEVPVIQAGTLTIN